MFDNVNWNELLNNVISHLEKDWETLIIKADISKSSYSAKFYYAQKDKEFVDLYNVIDNEKTSAVFGDTVAALKPITANFGSYGEGMFLTVKAERNGNVKVSYRYIKDADRLPYDEGNKYLQLNEKDYL